MAYTNGSMQATSLQVQAGIIVAPGVNRVRSPKAPIRDITPYGVQDTKNRKHIVIAALAMRISAVSLLLSTLERRDSTFIFLA